MSATHKQLQNIVANELGVTREAIEEIVRKRVETIIARSEFTKLIREQVAATLNSMVKQGRHDYVSIRSIVAKEAEEFIRKRLALTFSEPPAPPAISTAPDDDFPF